MEKKCTDEQIIEGLKAGMTCADIGRKYGLARASVSERKQRLLKKGFSAEHKGWDSAVPDGFRLKGRSIMKDQNGNVILQWEKSTVDSERQYEIVKEMCQGFVTDMPKLLPVTIYDDHLVEDKKLAVYPLGDPHVGMLSWEPETGQNWDLKIAEQAFCSIFDRVVRTAPRCKEALIINLGDFFHVDNLEGVTSRSGNFLDKDGRFAKMILIGIKIIRQMIATALEHHRHVTVINVIGNHDDTSAIFLSVALKHIYENEPRVHIDESCAPFHYYKFGQVLIGAHHGHTCKMEKLPAVMAADKPKEWGDSQFRYWLTGHIHHDSKQEHPGCMVESFRTLAARDAYANAGGWRSGQDTKCIVYHQDHGEIERHTIDISQIQLNKPC